MLNDKKIDHAVLANTESLLNSINEIDTSDVDSDLLELTIYRVSHLLDSLNAADPALVSEQVLNNINTEINQAVAHVSQTIHFELYVANRVQNTLQYLVGPLALSGATRDASNSVSSLRRSVAQHRLRVKRKTEEIEAELNSEVEGLKSEYASFSNDFAESSSEIALALSEFEKNSKSKKTEAQAVIDTVENLATVKMDEISSRIAKKEEDIDASYEKHIEKLKVSKDEMNELLGIAGNNALFGSYKKTAKEEKNASFRWSIVALLALILSTVFAFFLFDSVRDDIATVGQVFARFVYFAATGAVAAYSGNRASEHKKAHRHYEQRALELAALKPFIKDLSTKKQQDIIEKTTYKMFGAKSPLLQPRKNEEGIPTSSLEIIKELAKALSKIPSDSNTK